MRGHYTSPLSDQNNKSQLTFYPVIPRLRHPLPATTGPGAQLGGAVASDYLASDGYTAQPRGNGRSASGSAAAGSVSRHWGACEQLTRRSVAAFLVAETVRPR